MKRVVPLVMLSFLLSAGPAVPQDRQLVPMAMPSDKKPAQEAMPPAGTQETVSTEDAMNPAIDSETVTGAVMTERDMLQYCVNIADSARETRYAIIERTLNEKQEQIDKKLVELREKIDSIRQYVEVREKFRTAAEQQVVSIFETMRPDAAANQLSELDTGLSASIIMRLDPKISSKIMTEMAPKQAAMIANYLTAAMKQAGKEQPKQ